MMGCARLQSILGCGSANVRIALPHVDVRIAADNEKNECLNKAVSLLAVPLLGCELHTKVYQND